MPVQRLKDILNNMNCASDEFNIVQLQTEITSFAVEINEVEPGTLFFVFCELDFAMNGITALGLDTYQQIDTAFSRGAVACIVRNDQRVVRKLESYHRSKSFVYVDDVVLSLQALARSYFSKRDLPVIAVTGSAGKTSVKDLIAELLRTSGRQVLATPGSRNNGIGVPLTLLNLASDIHYDVVVLEFGMSTTFPEIRTLCSIAPPSIAVLLNVMPVHLQGLETIDAILFAKAQIIEGMRKGGIAIFNGDDPLIRKLRCLRNARSFSIQTDSDYRASDIDASNMSSGSFAMNMSGERYSVHHQMRSSFAVMNSLAAISACHQFGLNIDFLVNAISNARTPSGRGNEIQFEHGVSIIDESYNSNPISLLLTVQNLAVNRNGRRVIVIAGAMLELGKDSNRFHFQTGRALKALHVDTLLVVGEVGRHMVDGFGVGSIYCPDADTSFHVALSILRRGDLVLIKGSRAVRLERVVAEFRRRFNSTKLYKC